MLPTPSFRRVAGRPTLSPPAERVGELGPPSAHRPHRTSYKGKRSARTYLTTAVPRGKLAGFRSKS